MKGHLKKTLFMDLVTINLEMEIVSKEIFHKILLKGR